MKKASLYKLFTISLRDILSAYGHNPLVRGFLRLIFAIPALRFALFMAQCDREIPQRGLREASRKLLRRFYRGVTVLGEKPHREGGLLIVANHPGVGDSLALLSSLERDDIRLVAGEREFFFALPNLLPYLILVPEDPSKRTGVLRAMVDDLRQGKTVILYPAGEIEPDPFLHPDESFLKPWSSAIGLLVRLAQQGGFHFRIQPAISAQVLPPHVLGPSYAKKPALRNTLERKAVGKIIGLGRATSDSILLVWGPGISSQPLSGLSASAVTDKVMDETIDAFHRFVPIGETAGLLNRRLGHPLQQDRIGT